MGRIKDIVEGGASKFGDSIKSAKDKLTSSFHFGGTGNRPDGSTLGLSTPTKMTGNTAIGRSGGGATQFGTTTSSGQLTGVHAAGSRTPRNPGDPSRHSRSSGGDKTSGTTGTKTGPSTSGKNPNVSTDKSGRGPRYAKGGKVERTNMTKKKIPAKKGKRMAMGGMMQAATNKMRPGVMPGRGNEGAIVGRPMPMPRPGLPKPGTPIMNDPGFSVDLPPGLGGRVPRPRPIRPGMPQSMPGTMKGGGLARKGVGQALKRGGMVKGGGCAKRGVKKARNV